MVIKVSGVCGRLLLVAFWLVTPVIITIFSNWVGVVVFGAELCLKGVSNNGYGYSLFASLGFLFLVEAIFVGLFIYTGLSMLFEWILTGEK